MRMRDWTGVVRRPSDSMKEKVSELIQFLEREGFKCLMNQESDSFGDFIFIYSGDILSIIIICDKSQLFIDVQKNGKRDKFDLTLVMCLLNIDLNNNDIIFVLKSNLVEIEKLFLPENYENTYIKLKELQKQRADKMFPH